MTKSYPLIIHYKDDGKTSDRELKLTLRSMSENLSLSRVLIVGDKPTWASREIEHIPFDHPYRANKDANIAHAILKGGLQLMSDGYTGNVIVAADDCAVLRPVEIKCYVAEPFLRFMDDYPRRNKENRWWTYPYNAMIYCMKKGWKHDNCAGHTPTLVSVGSILTLLDVPFGERHFSGYTIMSNAERTFGTVEDGVINKCHPKVLISRAESGEIIESDFCNWCPRSGTEEFLDALESLFPARSLYEKNLCPAND